MPTVDVEDVDGVGPTLRHVERCSHAGIDQVAYRGRADMLLEQLERGEPVDGQRLQLLAVACVRIDGDHAPVRVQLTHGEREEHGAAAQITADLYDGRGA